MGLSPRVRGSLLTLRSLQVSFGGSIPASAGQPPSPKCHSRQGQVYPRECGAAVSGVNRTKLRLGLSPRVRGSRHDRGGQGQGPGSIPASAGQPSSHPGNVGFIRVYPRECGAAAAAIQVVGIAVGLSPRVRGSLYQPVVGFGLLRSIPASAGQPQLALPPA